MNKKLVDLKQVSAAALAMAHILVPEWLPGGKREGAEWVALNPQRHDSKAGSFKVNLNTGVWNDFACDGVKGGDLLDLFQFVFGYGNVIEAAKALAERLGVAAVEQAVVQKPKSEKDDWDIVMPVPDGAPVMDTNHIHYKNLTLKSVFKDAEGCVLGGIMRFESRSKGKVTLPLTLWKHKKTGNMRWQWWQWPEPRPLFGLDDLAARPDAPVLIVEGEKCKMAADASFLAKQFVVITWSGGTNGLDKTDWSPIVGRKVCLWPDADAQRQKLTKAEKDAGVDPASKHYLGAALQPGQKAMDTIAKILIKQSCVVHMLTLPMPGEWPNGFDVADALENPDVMDIKSSISNAWYVDPEILREPLPLQPITSDVDEMGLVADDAPTIRDEADYGDARGEDDGESRLEEYSQELLKNYWLVEGKNRAINIKSGVEYSRMALAARFSKEAVESWFNNPRKHLATHAEVAEMKRAAEKRLVQSRPEVVSNLKRYTYLDGSLNVWDAQLNAIIPTSAAKEAMGEDYKDWQNSPSRRVIPMANVVFEPGIEMGEDYINLFQGLPFQYTHPVAKADLPTDLTLLMGEFTGCAEIISLIQHLCNDDNEIVRWLLNWIAYPLQNVGAKMGTSILMHSDVHGTGKSLLWEKIIKPLYGRNCAATAGQHDMESQYTGGRSGKLFMLFEEIFAPKDKYGAAGAVKQMVTGETHQIHKKFMDAYEEANRMNCVFLSNFIQPLPLEEHDRRFLVVWPNTTTPDDVVDCVLEEINNGGLQVFFNFLMALPLTIQMDGVEKRFDAHTWPPMNAAKKQIIEWGLSGWQLFYRQWKDGDLDVVYGSCRVDDVWRFYQVWCSRNNEKALKRNQFVIAIGTKIPKARRRWRCLNANDKSESQAMIYKVGLEAKGQPESDYLGETVLKFAAQVSAYIDGELDAI